MELILSGNPNINTIRSVIYFANLSFDKKLEKVYFFDSKESLYDKKGEPIEHIRSELIRHYIARNVKIESIVLEKEKLHQEIPKLISEQLKIYDKDKMIVDLTNGNKYVSSILYASASLSKIKNLFFLYIPLNKHDELPENLNKDEYVIDVVSPLENLESIGKNTHFEIIYYKEEAEEIINSFNKYNLESSFLRNTFKNQMCSAIDNYFLGKYSDSIGNLGQIIEEISLEICPKIKNFARGKITNKLPNDFNNSILWLHQNFSEKLRRKRNENLDDFEEKLKLIQNIDKIIDVIRVYRNLNNHPYDFLRSKDEAKMIIDNTLYLLKLIIKTGVLA